MRFIGIVVLLALPVPAFSQQASCNRLVTIQRTDLTDSRAVLMRALSIVQRHRHRSDMLRRSMDAEQFCSDSATFLQRWSSRPIGGSLVAGLPLAALARTNSAYPRDRNDGAMWSGAGFNGQIEAGALGHWRFITAAVYPKLVYQQNKDFAFPRSQFIDRSEYANPYISGIDLPKRMGPSAFSTFDAGNSFIEAASASFYTAFSHENLWLGPTQVHSLLLSNSAPGFLHLRFGTRNPIDLKIARLEAQVFYGTVKESDYNRSGTRDSHLYQGILLSIEPKALAGLHLGFTRVLRDTAFTGQPNVGYYFKRLIDSPFYDSGGAGEDPADRQGALYARWVLPESGFEAYLEWAREDFPFSLLNLALEPDYSQVWAAGIQKVYLSDRRLTRVYGELVHLGQAAPVRGGRNIVRFYATRDPGLTNRGQMLGAGVGPGSDAQTLGLDVFDGRSRTGVMLERVRYDDDTYYEYFSRRFSESRHDVELTGEIRRTQFVGPLTVEGALRLSRRYNRDFLSALNDTPGITVENNIGTELSIHWTPRW